MKDERIELCPGHPSIKSSGVGRMCTSKELGEYMEKRFDYINKQFGDNKNGNSQDRKNSTRNTD